MAKKLGTNTLLVPNLKVGGPVFPGPYGCYAYVWRLNFGGRLESRSGLQIHTGFALAEVCTLGILVFVAAATTAITTKLAYVGPG